MVRQPGHQVTYIVGIDIGLTGTAVAHAEYSSSERVEHRAHDQSETNGGVRVIQTWPTVTPGRVENKVPTLIEVKPGEVQRKWGFECTHNYSPFRNPNDDVYVKRYFKLLLEDGFLQKGHPGLGNGTEISLGEAKDWCRSYLQSLYNWIGLCLESSYRERGMNFYGDQIEYIFSLPTTWPDQTVELFRGIIKDAGFGSIPSHNVSIGPMETEAAAVYALKHSDEVYMKNDQIIVCDVGGGTTGVAALELTSEDRGIFDMKRLCAIEGDIIGSVQIDEEVKELISRRLKMVNAASGQRQPERDSRALEAFQSIKHVIGKDEAEELPYLTLERAVKGEPQADYPEAGVFSGKMKVELSEIHKIFDSKVRGIARLIDTQKTRIHNVHSSNGTRMPFLILTGGLGSSEYVYKRLKDLYTNHLRVVRVREPQLAICKGLVLDYIYRHTCGAPKMRHYPASYGVVSREEFNKKKHRNGKPVLDPVSKRRYVEEQIDWLIDKDASIGSDQLVPVHKSFRNLGSRDNETHWEETVVTYDGPLTTRPHIYCESLEESAMVVQCHITPGRADEHNGAMKKKRKRLPWLKLIKFGEYWKLNYEVRLTVGAAGPEFELWYNKKRITQ